MAAMASNDFKIRPATMDDFDLILNLITAQNTLDYGAPLTSPNDLRTSWEASNLDMALDTWVALNADEQIVGYAVLSSRDTAGEIERGLPELDQCAAPIRTGRYADGSKISYLPQRTCPRR
jgi:hypothetical protein